MRGARSDLVVAAGAAVTLDRLLTWHCPYQPLPICAAVRLRPAPPAHRRWWVGAASAASNVAAGHKVHVSPGKLWPVPRYEFRCRECSETFEVNRPMTASGEPAQCPSGHGDTVRLLSTVALSGGTSGHAGRAAAPAGGCCGGGCCG